MTKLFKNAKIVDIENGTIFDADIQVENGSVKSFDKTDDFDGEVIDLWGNFVLPSFVNSFMDSVEAGRKSFFCEKSECEIEKRKTSLQNLFLTKNLCAGSVFVNDVSKTGATVLENLEDKMEKELSDLSMEIAEKKVRPFVKIGQDLLSLGSVDKLFGKSAVLVLEDFGFLDRQAVIVGANCLEKDDVEVLKNFDCDFVCLAGEDAKVGRRQLNIHSLLSKGVGVSLGSGSCAEIDFFGFMRQMLAGCRALFEDESVLSEQEVLAIATNADIMGRKNRVEIGASASFIVVDARESLYDDIFKTLVWERSKSDVLMSVKDGEVLQKNGEILMKNMPDYATIIKNLKG